MLKTTDTLALIIDFQERLLPAMNEHEKLAKQSEILIKGLKVLDIPMIITQQYTKGLGMSEKFIFATAGSDGYMDKLTFSAMRNEQISEAIKQSKKKNVIVCGIEAHICVLQTCLDLKKQGFVPYLVLDCTGSRKKADWDMTIIRAQQEGITVTSSESILFELLGEASGDTFKTISKMIR